MNKIMQLAENFDSNGLAEGIDNFDEDKFSEYYEDLLMLNLPAEREQSIAKFLLAIKLLGKDIVDGYLEISGLME